LSNFSGSRGLREVTGYGIAAFHERSACGRDERPELPDLIDTPALFRISRLARRFAYPYRYG